MLGRKLFRTVRPYFSAAAVIVTAVLLVFTIYFTQAKPQWTVFLTGILVAAILAEVTRATRAEWRVLRRTSQLSSLKDKLDRETLLRKNAEAKMAADKPRLLLLDEEMLTMIVMVDADGNCRYHNRAFREWQRLRPEQIDGHPLSKVLGVKVYEEIEPYIRKSMNGEKAHYNRKQGMKDGAVYNLLVKHLPTFGEGGKVTGFYILADDITERRDVLALPGEESLLTEHQLNLEAPIAVLNDDKGNQNLFIDSMSEQITGQKHAGGWIVEAIEKGEFRLLFQLIAPLAINSREARHYEIFIRLREEAEGIMPPGAFFPLAEKHGLMPFLDRWVVRHVLELASREHRQELLDKGSMLFVNLDKSSICDQEFPEYVHVTLQEYDVPSSILCFEVPYSDLAMLGAKAIRFIQEIRMLGCHVALSGFGRDAVSFDRIRGFQVEFLKIDGSIILNIHRDPVEMAKVIAINRVAKKIGVKTIAEFVETNETIAKLKEIGIDFAQGFGISKPRGFD